MTLGCGIVLGCITVGPITDLGDGVLVMPGVGIIGVGMLDLDGDGTTGDMVIHIMAMAIMATLTTIIITEITTEEELPTMRAEEAVT